MNIYYKTLIAVTLLVPAVVWATGLFLKCSPGPGCMAIGFVAFLALGIAIAALLLIGIALLVAHLTRTTSFATVGSIVLIVVWFAVAIADLFMFWMFLSNFSGLFLR